MNGGKGLYLTNALPSLPFARDGRTAIGQSYPARSALLRRRTLRPRPYRDHFIPHEMKVNQFRLFRRVEVGGYGPSRARSFNSCQVAAAVAMG